MNADDAAPHDVLEENVGRLFERLESRGPMPEAARVRILDRLLREASPPARSARDAGRARRRLRWAGLAAALLLAAGLLTGDRDEPATSGGRGAGVSFAIHLVAAGPGGGVVMASSSQGGEPVPIASERHVSNVDVEAARVARTDAGGCQVDVRLTGAGTRKLARLTRDHVGERLALLIDGRVAMTPTIRSEIAQGTVALTGDFTDARCEEIARGLSVRQ